ncbi:MAG: D-alanyl-D-alanine carboxypeptidase [Cyclobacteriaceae bacterium]
MKQSRTIVRKSIADSPLFNQHFTGFALYDPETGGYLQEQNADKYFNPASNTKLFTFYAGLKMLDDSVPGLKYAINGDSLIFWGTGDPSFLHPDFASQRVFDFLKKSDKDLYYASGAFQDTHFGSGWAWDDYSYYFQTERSGMPIYGNQVSFVYDSLASDYSLRPKFFNDFSEILDERAFAFYPNRNVEQNIFSFYPDPARSLRKNRVPFKTSDELLVELLADTLKKAVTPIAFQSGEDVDVIYSRRMNELYAWMLKASDNFIAEQILYLCASQRGDTLNSARVRAYMTINHLDDLPSQAIWKDGSGLSRYNLFTPRSMVMLLEKIKSEIPEETILNLLPKGGVDGTLRNWYKSDSEDPYIFAKTGTFSNNHSLSGFIKTASGKLLTFSFMNNNYNSSSAPVKLEMEKTLKLVRERY